MLCFSVIIVTKNRISFLKRAINSTISNTLKPMEIVIVNDGGEYVSEKDFIVNSIPLKIVNNLKSKGANYSRNLGVSLCSAPIVFFLDDDDFFTKESFEHRLKDFANPNIGLSFCSAKTVTANSLEDEQNGRLMLAKNNDDFFSALTTMGNVVGSTSRVAVRRIYFNEVKGFDENLSCLQDYDLWIRMSRICEFKANEHVGILYTIHTNGNQISSKFETFISTSDYLINKYIDDVPDLNKFKSFLYFRVALSAVGSCYKVRFKYSILSFINYPNIKSVVTLISPSFLFHWLKVI